MLHYKIYQNTTKGNKAYGKWLARATVNQTIGLDKLAEHMANHNTPYSKGAIYGVLTDMVNCIRELVLDGNAVKIPNLAIFSAGITTTGAEARETFLPSRNILSAHLRARSTGEFTRAELTAAARMQEADIYATENTNLSDGIADNSLQLFWCSLARVAKINFMMAAMLTDSNLVALTLGIIRHRLYGYRLIVIRTDMHTLNT